MFCHTDSPLGWGQTKKTNPKTFFSINQLCGLKYYSHSIKSSIMSYSNILHDDALVVQLTVSQIKAIIRDVLQESPSYLTSEKSETLTIEEVSVLTGYKKATLYKLTHERKIPFHKPAHGGRRIFFKRAEINQWLESNLFETYEESFENLKGKKVLNSKLNSYEKSK